MSILRKPELISEKKIGKGQRLPEVVVYEHINFNGWEYRTNLDVVYIGDDWNDNISSIVVFSGTWRFYNNVGFDESGGYIDLGVGAYSRVEDYGIANDSITSFKAIAS